MKSRLFQGKTIHSRYAPRRNTFRYRMFWMSIDLDELDELDRELRFFGHNRRALVSIFDRDYGGAGEGDIQHRIRQHLERADPHEPVGQIRLMTIPRIVGYVFNPVSFYLCSPSEGTTRTLVAEVRNTFGEMHHYVSRLEPEIRSDNTSLRCRIPKQFFVSPFFPVEGEYHIRIRDSIEEFSIDISLHDQTGVVFSASMSGEGRELNSRNLSRTLLRSPFFALTIMTKIHFQALKLYFVHRLVMFQKPPPSHVSTLSIASVPWWMRFRAACVRLGARRRSPSHLGSEGASPSEESS